MDGPGIGFVNSFPHKRKKTFPSISINIAYK